MVKSSYNALVIFLVLLTAKLAFAIPGDFVVPLETATGFQEYHLDGIEDLRKVVVPTAANDGYVLTYDWASDIYYWAPILGDMSTTVYDTDHNDKCDDADHLSGDLDPDQLAGDTVDDNKIDNSLLDNDVIIQQDIDTLPELEAIVGVLFWTHNDGQLTDDNVSNDNVEWMRTSGAVGTAPLSDGSGHLVMTPVVQTSQINTLSGLESLVGVQFWTHADGNLIDDNVSDDNVESMRTNGANNTAPLSDGNHNLIMVRVVRLDEINSPDKLDNIIGAHVLVDGSNLLNDLRIAVSGDFHNLGGVDDDQPDSDAEVPDDITIGSGGYVDPNALPANLLYDTSIDTEYELSNINSNIVFKDTLNKWETTNSTTINSNTITITSTQKHISIDTEGGSSTDDVTSINYNGNIGDIVIFHAADDSHTVVFRNNSQLHIGSDFTLDSQWDVIALMYMGSNNWIRLFSSDNGT